MVFLQVLGAVSLLVGGVGWIYQVVTAGALGLERRGIRDQDSPSREARATARTLIVSVVLVTTLSPAFTILATYAYDQMTKEDDSGYYVLIGLTVFIAVGGLLLVTWLTRSADHEYASYGDLRRDVLDAQKKGPLTSHEARTFLVALKALESKEANRASWMPHGKMPNAWGTLVEDVAKDVSTDRPHTSISEGVKKSDVWTYFRRRKKKVAFPFLSWILGGICVLGAMAHARSDAWFGVIGIAIWAISASLFFGMALHALLRQQLVVKLSELVIERRQRTECQALLETPTNTTRGESLSRGDLLRTAWRNIAAALCPTAQSADLRY